MSRLHNSSHLQGVLQHVVSVCLSTFLLASLCRDTGWQGLHTGLQVVFWGLEVALHFPSVVYVIFRLCRWACNLQWPVPSMKPVVCSVLLSFTVNLQGICCTFSCLHTFVIYFFFYSFNYNFCGIFLYLFFLSCFISYHILLMSLY